MPDALHTLINRLIIMLDLLYDAAKYENDIWILISNIIENIQQTSMAIRDHPL